MNILHGFGTNCQCWLVISEFTLKDYPRVKGACSFFCLSKQSNRSPHIIHSIELLWTHLSNIQGERTEEIEAPVACVAFCGHALYTAIMRRVLKEGNTHDRIHFNRMLIEVSILSPIVSVC